MCAPIKAAATGERVLELRVACVVAKRRTSLPFYNPKANVKPACGEMDSEIPFAALKKEKPVRGARAGRPGAPAARPAARDPARRRGRSGEWNAQGPLGLRAAGGDAKIRAKRLKTLILDSARARRHLGHPQEQAWWTSTRAGAGVGSRVRTPMEYERQQVPARSALPGASGRAVADASHGSDSPEQSIDDRAPACSPLRYRRPSTSACHTSTS